MLSVSCRVLRIVVCQERLCQNSIREESCLQRCQQSAPCHRISANQQTCIAPFQSGASRLGSSRSLVEGLPSSCFQHYPRHRHRSRIRGCSYDGIKTFCHQGTSAAVSVRPCTEARHVQNINLEPQWQHAHVIQGMRLTEGALHTAMQHALYIAMQRALCTATQSNVLCTLQCNVLCALQCKATCSVHCNATCI